MIALITFYCYRIPNCLFPPTLWAQGRQGPFLSCPSQFPHSESNVCPICTEDWMSWECETVCSLSPSPRRIKGWDGNCDQFAGNPVNRIPNFTRAQLYPDYDKNPEMRIRSTRCVTSDQLLNIFIWAADFWVAEGSIGKYSKHNVNMSAQLWRPRRNGVIP